MTRGTSARDYSYIKSTEYSVELGRGCLYQIMSPRARSTIGSTASSYADIVPATHDLVFQALTWHCSDDIADESADKEDSDSVDDEDDDDDHHAGKKYIKPKPKHYLIKAFGVLEDGRAVALTVTGFTPFFYIKLSDGLTESQVANVARCMTQGSVSREAFKGCDVLNVRPLKKKDYWGFSNGAQHTFLRVTCNTLRGMRRAAKNLEAMQWIKGVFGVPPPGIKVSLYESNIDPLLRFFHVRDLQPAGWIRVAKGCYRRDGPCAMAATCHLDFTCKWQDCAATVNNSIAPMLVASFDIECSSSHGDFPVAKKTYTKVAQNLCAWFTTFSVGKSEFAAKEALVDAMVAPFWDQLPARVQQDRRGAERLCSTGAMARAYTKTPLTSLDGAKIAAIAKRIVDDVYLCLKGRYPNQTPATSVISLINDKLTRAFGGIAALQGDEVIQIGTTFHRYGSRDVCHRWVGTLGTCDAIEDDVTVVQCSSERDLLLSWARMMQAADPDILTGWNIFGFDIEYVYARAEEAMCEDEVCKLLSRLRNVSRPMRLNEATGSWTTGSWLKEQRLSSSALGDNVMRYLDMHGRVMIDLMKVVQRDHKLDSYKLDLVAQHFLGLRKNDVSPAEIFKLQRGTSADRRKIAEYCVQDCALCNHLTVKLEILANNVGMANVCSVPLSFIFMRGQGVKIFSLVAKQCKTDGFLIPTQKYVATADGSNNDEDGGYEGAIVLTPTPGIYIDDPVAVLDYASLYPSSMISENLSHDCLVLDKKYDNLPGVEYETITYDEGDRQVSCRFAQIEGKGVLPRILMQLLQQRKATRKRMESVIVTTEDGVEHRGLYDATTGWLTDLVANGQQRNIGAGLPTTAEFSEFQKAVLDGLQLAYKVTANSLYGQMGARTSPLYLKQIAACTTATGRKMIMMAKDFLEKNYCAQIVYGDSVAGYTPVVVRWNDRVYIEAIDKIPDMIARASATKHAWLPCKDEGRHTKDAIDIESDELFVWSDDGWTRVKRLIRHRLAPGKRMIRVATVSGVVDVTDDHSLLRPDGKTIVKPQELLMGERLLHADLPVVAAPAKGDAATADVDIIDASSTNVPADVLHMSEVVRKAYWYRMCHVEVGRQHHHNQESDNNMLHAARVFALAASLGHFVQVSIDSRDTDLVELEVINGAAQDGGGRGAWRSKNTDAVVDVIELPPTHYEGSLVYDFTTDNNKFAAGVGRIVVHNTDSIFVVFPKSKELGNSGMIIHEKGHAAIMPSIKLAMQASAEFKTRLKAPHDLEYEKTFWPWIILSKKRYVGNLYEHDDKKYKQKSMGIVLKRRDNAPLVKHIYGGCIDVILQRQDVPGSIKFLQEYLTHIVDGKVPLEDLVITKTLRAEYKNPEQIAHHVLAQRMAERDPGNKPQVNDRVPYVYIVPPPNADGKKDKVLQGDRVEHPEYVKSKGILPDYRFYLTNQVMKPVQQLFALVLEQLPGYQRAAAHWAHEKARLMLEYDGDEHKVLDKLQTLRENEVKALLFDPALVTIDARANNRAQKAFLTKWFKASTSGGEQKNKDMS